LPPPAGWRRALCAIIRPESWWPFGLGILTALMVLALREPAMFSEPTFGLDDLELYKHQHEGRLFYYHFGAVHLLQMTTGFLAQQLLPTEYVPFAMSWSSLLLSAVAPAAVLHPLANGLFASWPGRALLFGLLALLPLGSITLVASLAYQHVAYLFLGFLILTALLDVRSGAWLERATLPYFVALSSLFVACVWSAPISVVLLPIPVYCLVRPGKRNAYPRQKRFAIAALAGLLAYAAVGLRIADSVGRQLSGEAGVRQLCALFGDALTLWLSRVPFEVLFSFSARLWLANAFDAHWLATTIGAVVTALSAVVLWRRARSGGEAVFAEIAALYTSVALVAVAVFARRGQWNLESESGLWQFGYTRYFAAATMVWVVMFVLLSWRAIVRVLEKPAGAAALIAWLVALNYFENVRYEEPFVTELFKNREIRMLRELPRGSRAAQSLEVREGFRAIAALEGTLPPGSERRVQFPSFGGEYVVRQP
jgi:hypothetical protein